MKNYEINYGDHSIIITSNIDNISKGVILNDQGNLQEQIANFLNQPVAHNIIIKSNSTESTFNQLKLNFTNISAAGGLVKNEKDEYLFIFRKGKWDLPKGKLDEGETLEECAIREVKEETGIKNITLENYLMDTWHIYKESGKYILKQSSWYNMACSSNEKLIPQTEEDIQEVTWLKKEAFKLVLNNTYPAIKKIIYSIEV